MTLLELLRRELPKRGGWPEGAERARQDDDREICFEGACGVSYDFDVDEMSDDSLRWLNENNRATSDLYVTREQYVSTLRTEAERKRYAAIESIFEILDAGVSTSQDAIDVYDAIAAGKIPGVKLEV